MGDTGDCSAKLAEKMLGGWTLLGTNCPNCCIPLVRNKGEQKMFCVGCEQWMLNEQDGLVAAAAADAPPVTNDSSSEFVQDSQVNQVDEQHQHKQYNTIQNQTIQSLYRKMNTLRQQIDQSNLTADQMFPLIQTIKEIATTIKSLQELQSLSS